MGGNDDIHATASYRRELVRLGPKVIEGASMPVLKARQRPQSPSR
jgi:hypothetical protein